MPPRHAPFVPDFFFRWKAAPVWWRPGRRGATQARGSAGLRPGLKIFWISCGAEDPSAEAAALLTDPRAVRKPHPYSGGYTRPRPGIRGYQQRGVGKRPYRWPCAGGNARTVPARPRGAFSVPAVARQDGLAAALSTGGASPALARRWRCELEGWLAPRARMVLLMGRLRPLVLALHAETGQNTELFRRVAASPLQHWLAEGDLQSCRQWLLAELPPVLHVHIAELLDDLP